MSQHAAMEARFSLHGKTIRGTMEMGDHYALDFTDGTSLHINVHYGGPAEGGRVWLVPVLKDEAL